MMWMAISQIFMLFVSTCSWKNGKNSADGVESEEASTKTLSDSPNVIFEPADKTTKKFINKF